jgi:hypothetical protein
MIHGEAPKDMTRRDLTNQRFGRLVVLRPCGRDKWGKLLWECRCDCGEIKIVGKHDLLTGNTRSCGCLAREVRAANLKQVFNREKQQGDQTREARVWRNMIHRCCRPGATGYRYYGGRGIKVCERWRHSYANFLADMGRCPEGCSIDRINNDGDYEPGNCRWATKWQQARNKTNTRIPAAEVPKILDSTESIAELARKYRVYYSTIYHIKKQKS